MSTPFVLARLKDFPFRHEFLPVLLSLLLPLNFLEFKSCEMGVALVLTEDTAVSTEDRRTAIEYVPLIRT